MGSSEMTLTRRLRLALRSALAWRLSWAWAIGVVRSFVTSYLALAVALWILPGAQVTGSGAVASLAVGVLAVGALLRPLLVALTAITGAVGLLVAGLLAQGLVLGVALAVMPAVEPFSLVEVLLASWAVTVVAAALNWLLDTSTEEVFFAQVLGRTIGTAHRHPVPGPGLLAVQLDGVSEQIIRAAMTSGAMPNLTRWVRSGDHHLRGWETGLPATTPAGQAALLHGDTHSVPGFRWYDKDQERVLVASRPTDLVEIERGMSDGRGLLAVGGVSISNLFSGDAPTRVLTMSDAQVPKAQRGAAAFMSTRTGFGRSMVLFVGQLITEWHQGRRQRRRDVVPRVRRGGSFLFLRGLTTVVLRDLNVSIVADQMARGAPAIYVDFVDYDEVAHHAGPSRPETMRTLEALDRIVGFFAEVAAEVSRDYEIVLLSDHGQAQGVTFAQLTGRSIEEVVSDLAGSSEQITPTEGSPETWGPANLITVSAPTSGRLLGQAAGSAARRGAGVSQDRPGQAAPSSPGQLLVLSSGSLAHVYLTGESGHVARERINELYPQLLPGLAAHSGIGLVVTRSADGELVVEGGHGWRVLGEQGSRGGAGADPLGCFGARAGADVVALASRAHIGDLILLGRHDVELGEVAAFEELVGSHGGLGGAQTGAMLIHPASWQVPTEQLDGPAVHDLMVRRLEELGLRAAGRAAPTAPAPAPDLPGPGS